MVPPTPSRRRFIATTLTGLLLSRSLSAAEQLNQQVGPAEDLMREHGVLKRILLIYQDILRRMDANEAFPPETLAASAQIIRSFIEDYHEKLEEEFVFPRMRKANKLADLCDLLETQHKAGRKVTDVTLRLATPDALKNPDSRKQLADSMRSFIRMYSPHEAREDTVLFPAFHEVTPPKEYDSLGELFEKREDQLFGDNGFEKNVAKVADLEKTLGIYDLAQFTPR